MLKKFLLLSFVSILPAFSAGSIDDVTKQDKVFLYLHAPDCGYCIKFNPLYNKLSSIFGTKNCKFLKVDATSPDGEYLVRNFGVYYLPYVIMIDNNKRTINNVVPKCLLNYACIKDATDKFVN